MLNNLTNFFNLIASRKVKTSVGPNDLVSIGVPDPRTPGIYQPAAIKACDLGGSGIIAEGTGAGSSVRIDAANCVTGLYSTALGKCNTVCGKLSSSLSGIANTSSAYYAITNGRGNVNTISNSSILSGALNIIAPEALPYCTNQLTRSYICNGQLTLSAYYGTRGDQTSFFTPGTTISNLKLIWGSPSEILTNLEVLGSCYNGTTTTICVDPSINTYSNYIIKTGPYTTFSSYYDSVIGGGLFNIIGGERGAAVTIGGGHNNYISGWGSTIAGGSYSTISGQYSVVGGGGGSDILCGNLNTIAGGQNSIYNSNYSFVGGGLNNMICAGSQGASTIGGGWFNLITNACSTIGGGSYNTVSSCYSIVGGGNQNIVSCVGSAILGGYCNIASGYFSGILGGSFNTASNTNSFIIGSNIASDRACTTFVNALSMKTAPTSADELPAGTIWVDTAAGNVLKMA